MERIIVYNTLSLEACMWFVFSFLRVDLNSCVRCSVSLDPLLEI